MSLHNRTNVAILSFSMTAVNEPSALHHVCTYPSIYIYMYTCYV